MGKKLFLTFLATVLLVGCLAFAVAAEDNVATIGTTGYTSLQAAVDAYTAADQPIVLQADIAENITVSKNVYLDLNGCDVTGKITVSAGTLYCMDSKTDDYTVEDTDGYG